MTDSESFQLTLVYVIGCPGAGKGTLCSMLASHFGWAHVSVGDELRSYVQLHSLNDEKIAECVRSNKLVPVESLAQIIKRRIRNVQNEGYAVCILDGFPRQADQIAHMQDVLGVPKRVFFMDCPRHVAKERVITRNLSGRTDSEEVFEQRFAEFSANNPAILDRYEREGKLIKLDTSNKADVSFSNLLAAIEQDFKVEN